LTVFVNADAGLRHAAPTYPEKRATSSDEARRFPKLAGWHWLCKIPLPRIENDSDDRTKDDKEDSP